MSSIYKDIENKYIVKSTAHTEPKMKRNLQPEIEKIKSINKSLMELGYISKEEIERLRIELNKLSNNLEYF